MGGRRSARRLPKEPVVLQITGLSHEGRGIAHVDGKTVFVHGALPGEQVQAVYRRCHRRYDEAETLVVEQAAAERVEPPCAAYARCGGCSLQHMHSDRQIAFKQSVLLELLQHVGGVVPDTLLAPLRGPQLGYRRRARLAVRKVAGKGRVLVGFRERYSPYVVDMHRCEVLHPLFGAAPDELSTLIGGLSVADAIPQLEVSVGQNGAAMVVRHLRELTAADRAALHDWGRSRGVELYLQAGDPRRLEPLSASPEVLHDVVDGWRLEFSPTDFLQVNAELNARMVAQALTLLDPGVDDTVLDLFCGLGNFSLPLAARAGRVIGVEGDAGLVARARHNAAINGLTGVEFIAADLAQLDQQPPWGRGRVDHVLLDPPRTGAAEVLDAVAALRPQRILYVSCNPSTLARDAGVLVHRHGYRLSQAGVMDMFPHTAHTESMAVFEPDAL
jgi:23S rRNA (uracil1939-C5)-methyltransferase